MQKNLKLSMNISSSSFSEKKPGQESTMAQLNSSMMIWLRGSSQRPGKDREGQCLGTCSSQSLRFNFMFFSFWSATCSRCTYVECGSPGCTAR